MTFLFLLGCNFHVGFLGQGMKISIEKQRGMVIIHRGMMTGTCTVPWNIL